ncbi:DUF2461 domain-containing protein [Formosa algae]|uniref:Uncharacterized protein (TIGR02453 family) n=1 Tax=Formosa algae TaxID=225843 RepID=A0A9X0YPB8_9FLAO|nr:DUF2461 domain-containing protein [Formosa algae]MBP1840897.1 uncharacterized protein (TIGR02453 family) [Formosa algae]MDQ0336206.1 uncharacterized protein (TIGR02453 family) [Formosa algae]OEI79979.1 TIGR02453 family protein [Formosa algae]
MISEQVLDFLNALEKNNDRVWFQDHKTEFRTVEKEMKAVFNELFTLLKTHDDVDAVKVFRIYRDVRFSKNKVPYKTHFGGTIHRVKPQLRGGYYLHVEPNNKSFIATGFWDPNKEDLLRIRKEFEVDAQEVRDIINDSRFKSTWGIIEGDELKTSPKGFDKTHPDIDLIRKKQFIFTKKYTDKEVLAPDFLEQVNGSFKVIRPYFDYMSDVLTTNINGESLI